MAKHGVIMDEVFDGDMEQSTDNTHSSDKSGGISLSSTVTFYDFEELELSTRGRGYLVNKYVYLRDKERPGRIYIRCQERKKCPARATIYPNMNGPKARLMAATAKHTHAPPRITRLKDKTRIEHIPTVHCETRPAQRASSRHPMALGLTTRSAPTEDESPNGTVVANVTMGTAYEQHKILEASTHYEQQPGPSNRSDKSPDYVIVGDDVIQIKEEPCDIENEPCTSGSSSYDDFRGQKIDSSSSRDVVAGLSASSWSAVGGARSLDDDERGKGLGEREEEYCVAKIEYDAVDEADDDGFILEQGSSMQCSLRSSRASHSSRLRLTSTCREFQRTRSINAPIPAPSFGPKACLKKVPPSQMMHVTDPSSQKLIWNESPLTVLVIKKMMDESVIEPYKKMIRYLLEEKNLVVYVEKKVLEEGELHNDKEFDKYRLKMKTFTDGKQLRDKIDFIVCLGGDGTLLYASSLFQEGTVPPVIAFHLGSFGFLTTYQFEEFQEAINILLQGNTPVTLRSRLKCLIFRDTNIPSDLDRENVNAIKPKKVPDPPNLQFKYECLNEVVIDRGPSPYLSNLDLYLDDKHITTVQGDGLIISTPTGSTAYAAAAGASMIHPNVPAILITPICPHTLSFRPIVVPAGVELKITVSPDARHTAWVSLDGKHRQEIHKGWCLRITNSVHPVASVCSVDQIVDWFDSLRACMHWNERKQQKSFKPRDRLRKGPSDNNLEALSQDGEVSGQNRT